MPSRCASALRTNRVAEVADADRLNPAPPARFRSEPGAEVGRVPAKPLEEIRPVLPVFPHLVEKRRAEQHEPQRINDCVQNLHLNTDDTGFCAAAERTDLIP
jgi:hypothetical protein